MQDMTLPYLYDVTAEQLHQWVQQQGAPAYRTRQIRQWLPKGLRSIDDWKNLPASLREALQRDFCVQGLQLEQRLESKLDDTVRYVFSLRDGHRVESVFMRYRTGTSICLSTQSGCRMGCRFCASTGIGFGRNLTAGELLAQVARVGLEQGERISHVVLMRIGEPLENYDAVVSFLRRLREEDGPGISLRHVTLSTCGLVPEILRLAQEGLPVNLALSLHAPDDALRQELMPIARKYPLREVLQAVFAYGEETGRRPTFEYALFRDCNDRPEHARALVRLLRNRLAHVNLIPANEFPGSPFRKSRPEAVRAFQTILQQAGIACTVRRSLGEDIAAACGQLRRIREEGEPSCRSVL